MKYILKPTSPPLALELLIKWLIENDRRFNATGPGIRASVRVDTACERDRDELFVELINDDCGLLAAAAEEPTAGYPPLTLRSATGEIQQTATARPWLPFIDAIRDAKDEPPRLDSVEAVSR